ncbi:FabD/lysophospholipase-like protein [Myriangium duriaei CBS 260.36]|uniref:FabD/lysophospholipase-like protein n=1 Tax=Myriangium duriaei CBS 260.36 TaxID=1168546 RepID=A0A9P4MKJ1_9PEZI|nr:FabD/lysophospholipase-like protein [Myriangium duriaei CBS 260.36]
MPLRPLSKPTTDPSPLDVTGLCLLSLDGGGVRGLSSLYILRGIMKRLNDRRKRLGQPSVRPHEVFDLMGGTSTGGLIAMMLGRLKMDVDESIEAYLKFAKECFSGVSNRASGSSRFRMHRKVKPKLDSTRLNNAVASLIKDRGLYEHTLLNDGGMRGCRTFVCTIDNNTKHLVLLRDYNLEEEDSIPVTIQDATRATLAATTFFEPVTIGHRTFSSASLGTNNPVEAVDAEVANLWCPGKSNLLTIVKCFVSIGTGNPGTKPFSDTAFEFFNKDLVALATETESTERKFVARWAQQLHEHRYFRFNVEQGLQDVGFDEYDDNKIGFIDGATEGYLTHQAQKFRVRGCVQNLYQKRDHTMPDIFSVVTRFDAEKYEQDIDQPSQDTKDSPDDSSPSQPQLPLVLMDSVLDRWFEFPWSIAKSWPSMRALLEQAFEHFPDLIMRIRINDFELMHGRRQIILPSVWEATVQPGWEVILLMREAPRTIPPRLPSPPAPPTEPRFTKFSKNASTRDFRINSRPKQSQDRDTRLANDGGSGSDSDSTSSYEYPPGPNKYGINSMYNDYPPVASTGIWNPNNRIYGDTTNDVRGHDPSKDYRPVIPTSRWNFNTGSYEDSNHVPRNGPFNTRPPPVVPTNSRNPNVRYHGYEDNTRKNNLSGDQPIISRSNWSPNYVFHGNSSNIQRSSPHSDRQPSVVQTSSQNPNYILYNDPGNLLRGGNSHPQPSVAQTSGHEPSGNLPADASNIRTDSPSNNFQPAIPINTLDINDRAHGDDEAWFSSRSRESSASE